MLRPILAVLAFVVSGVAAGQAPESPVRIAQLAYVEGALSYQEANEPASSALPERPLQPGDRLTTAREGRAELTLGSATVRLDQESDLRIADLDAQSVRFDLTGGAAIFRLEELLEGESFTVTTPNTTIDFRAPGEYRVDVPDDGTTTLTVRAGDAEVETAEGAVRVADGQRVRLEGPEALASLVAPQWTDDFDNWVLDREVQLAESAPPRDESEYAPDGTLDDYGDWQDDPVYGSVWMPSYAYGGYAPFSTGYWSYTGYGYSWVNPMPWSPYTNHHGHWAYLPHCNRHAWVPERRGDYGRRTARGESLVERVINEARRQDLIPDSRPATASREAERKARIASDELARRVDDNRRREPLAREASPRRPAQSGSLSAAQRNAASAAAAAAATARSNASRSNSSAASRPAPRPSSSSSSQSTSKSFGKPQDP